MPTFIEYVECSHCATRVSWLNSNPSARRNPKPRRPSADSFLASSREQFYVSASRARESVIVYTDNKAALREVIAEPEERVNATGLFTEAMRDDASRLHKRHERDLAFVQAGRAERDMNEREEVVYER